MPVLEESCWILLVLLRRISENPVGFFSSSPRPSVAVNTPLAAPALIAMLTYYLLGNYRSVGDALISDKAMRAREDAKHLRCATAAGN